MIKVFICIPTLASAGAERFATELSCNLDRESFEPVIVVTSNLSRESYFYQKLKKQGIKVYDVSDHNYMREILKIRRILKKEKPDIIHTNIGALLHMLLPVVLFGKGIKHVFTVHSMGYRIFTGLKKRIVSFCFHNKIVVPIAISDTVRKSVIEAYNMKDNDVELVYNGVDTSLFSYKVAREKETVTIATTGTLYDIKNHDLLIDAFKEAQKVVQDLELLIIGDGMLRTKLEDKVRNLNLQDKVTFVGNQSNVCEFLKKADMYCCTSKVEGLPISVLEAMSCGLPVVTTPAGGVVDIVFDELNGFIVNYDKKIIADKIIKLVTDKTMRSLMGKASREIALKRDIKICAKNYEKLYKRYLQMGHQDFKVGGNK